MRAALLVLLSFTGAALLTALVRRFALARGLLDLPNERSSHAVPTPRGGGLAIVVVVLGGLPWLIRADLLSLELTWGLLGGGGAVAAIGWLDDRAHVAAPWRLLVHFLAAGWVVYWAGAPTILTAFGLTIDTGYVGHVLTTLYVVWLINLYNFMDGIDGIAGIEAVTVCIGAIAIHRFAGVESGWAAPLLLASAAAGFLPFNLPRAKIFMGDVGSGFLGVAFGLLSLYAASMSPKLFWAWVVLIGAFVVDATVTLFRRLMRGERVYIAHRSHAYQRFSRHFGSHVLVSLGFGVINLLWLLPVAAAVAAGWIDGLLAVILGCAPLTWLAWRSGAGQPEDTTGLLESRPSTSVS